MNVREWPCVRVRIHPDAMDWIRKDAAKNKRTLNSEISFCVEQHIEATKRRWKATKPIPTPLTTERKTVDD